MSNTPRTTPSAIRQSDESTLAICWGDGVESLFPVRSLRLWCACAQCVDEWTGAPMLDPESIPGDVRPITIEPVGRYAIRINWSDGHETGIYTFERLRSLAETSLAG